MNYIYRHYHIPRTTEKAAGSLIRSLMISGGTIVSFGSLRNGYPETKVSYWESFYTLRFVRQEDLDCFHSLGFTTTEPERVMGAEPWCDDQV